MADLGPNAVPDRIAIDAHGYGWRVWDGEDHWSMVPQNPDNSPVPQPVTWFVPAATDDDWERFCNDITEHAPLSFDGDVGHEAIAVEYVRWLERMAVRSLPGERDVDEYDDERLRELADVLAAVSLELPEPPR